MIMETIASPGGPPLFPSSSFSSDPFPFIITKRSLLSISDAPPLPLFSAVSQVSAIVSTAAAVSALTLFWSTQQHYIKTPAAKPRLSRLTKMQQL